MEATTEALGKYELLLDMKSLDYEIRELTHYSESCSDCYRLLTQRLDKLCGFMTRSANKRAWGLYGDTEEVQALAAQLRESSSFALCRMEKYHSRCLYRKNPDLQDYLSALSGSVRNEQARYGISSASRVVFIGAGAFPLSSLILARDSGAAVLGLDIDAEAVELAERAAELFGLTGQAAFTGQRVGELAFAREATHVIVASLVPDKLELLEELYAVVPPDAQVILRYGNGLKSVFNYPLDGPFGDAWTSSKLPACGMLYDAVLLRKQPPLFVP